MRFFRKYHKWAGLILAFIIIMFSISGIILNHRRTFSSVDLPRRILPEEFRFKNWNNAAVKSSFKLSADSVLLYGTSGIWLTDSLQTGFTEYTNGFKRGADNRIVNRIVRVAGKDIYAVSTFDLYRLDEQGIWINLTNIAGIDERISDMENVGDTLVILTRSHLFYTIGSSGDFTRMELKSPDDYEPVTGTFRTMWLLHSGQLFGTGGKFFVDFLGLLLIMVSITGIIYFFCPGLIKRKKKKEKPVKKTVDIMKLAIRWHNKIGIFFLIFFLLLSVTGMFLRPPLLIAIVRSHVKNIPGTVLDSPNPWNDKLRTIRYDRNFQHFILYTSSGFYSLKEMEGIPHKIQISPPVSVMGVTVLEPTSKGWLVGSFSGLFHWNRDNDRIINSRTGQIVTGIQRGRPVSSFPVCGYSNDFITPVIFEYNKGALPAGVNRDFPPMPEHFGSGRISLWHLALEVHTGRIYNPITGIFADLYTFLAGLLISLVLISGYMVYRKRYGK